MLALPLALPWLGAVGCAALDGRRRTVGWAALGTLLLHLAALGWLAADVLRTGPREHVTGNWPAGIGIVLRADALGVTFAFTSSLALALCLGAMLVRGEASRAFPALVLFEAAGLTGVFLTGDAFNFFVFFELSMLAAYGLAVHGDEREPIRATFIFAVVNLLGSFLFLIAVAALYHVTGTLELEAIGERMAAVEPGAAAIIAVTVFVAFGVKLGLFPFHFWLPPLYTGTHPVVAAILSGAVANIGAYGLLRFGVDVLPRELDRGATVLAVLGAASILYGALQALARRAVPEVLAYSAIGQAGYVLVAIAIGGPAGYAAAVVYAVANSLNKVMLFLVADLRGPIAGAAFAIGAFSVAGMPPTAGFVAKLELFLAAVDDGSVLLVALVFLGGALSFLYMFQAYQHSYWRVGAALAARPNQALALAVGALVVLGGLWPEPLAFLGSRAAEAFGGGP